MTADFAAAVDFLSMADSAPQADCAATYAPLTSAQIDPASPTHRAKTKPSASPSPAPTPHLHIAAAVPSRRQSDAQSLQSYPYKKPIPRSFESVRNLPHSNLGRIPPLCPLFSDATRPTLHQSSAHLCALCVSALSFRNHIANCRAASLATVRPPPASESMTQSNAPSPHSHALAVSLHRRNRPTTGTTADCATRRQTHRPLQPRHGPRLRHRRRRQRGLRPQR